MPTTDRPWALVTGASSGIGYELAKLLAADGHPVVLVARRKDRLTGLAEELEAKHGVDTLVVEADLARPGSATQVAAQVEATGRPVDILVNNAGYGVYGPFAETDLDDELALLQVNVVALTALTKALLPGMLARRQGRILNVASTAAFQPGPLMAVYYASKAYVLSFSEALATELAGTGVAVSTLCPGPTRSEFQQRAKLDRSRFLKAMKLPSSAEVAREGYQGLLRGRRVVIPGARNRLGAFLVRIFPRHWVTAVVHKLQSPEGRPPTAGQTTG